MSQPHHADHMAKVFDLDNVKVARTPLPPGTSVSKLERVNLKQKSQHRLDGNEVAVQQQRKPSRAKTSDEAMQRVCMDTAAPDQSPAQSTESDASIGKNLTRFKEVWGQLSHHAPATRPDTCYADSLLGQVSAGPRMRRWRLAQQTMRYAFNAKTHGVQFRKLKNDKVNKMGALLTHHSGKALWLDHKPGTFSC